MPSREPAGGRRSRPCHARSPEPEPEWRGLRQAGAGGGHPAMAIHSLPAHSLPAHSLPAHSLPAHSLPAHPP
ncbi:hypothetical protein, partial [Nonomuraea candida]|uniref:hypothetical protein n=1 Tax=Nonomuraea candida TaxID=359159 RepID=UPI001B801216